MFFCILNMLKSLFVFVNIQRACDAKYLYEKKFFTLCSRHVSLRRLFGCGVRRVFIPFSSYLQTAKP